MSERKGERIGWTWGWTGGFVWVPIVSAVFLWQGHLAAGLVGLALFVLAIFVIRTFAPWRRPATPYWRLMAVGYGLFLASAVWAIWAFGATLADLSDDWPWLLWIGPAFLPIVINGRRTWQDGESKDRREP